MSRVFISYKRADKEKVLPLKKKIEDAIGEPCWIDLDGIECDAQFVEVIMRNINDASIFVFMYSRHHSKIRNYIQDWTVRELNYALKKEKKIVFVNIDNAPMTDWLDFMFPQKQQVHATSESEFDALLIDLQKWLTIKKDAQAPFIATVNNIQNSHSKYTSFISKHKYTIILIAIIIGVLSLVSLFFAKLSSPKPNPNITTETPASIISKEDPEIYYQKAEENFIAQDYSNAVNYYQKAADCGYAKAQNNLGCMYRWGLGIDQSDENAVRWYKQSADQGDSYGQNNLAYMLENGFGVQKNENQARLYYQKSAEQENPYAQANIGLFYWKGKGGLEKDNSEAVHYYKLSSKQNNLYGYTELGKLYEAGIEVNQSIPSAVALWKEAAKLGNAEACTLLTHHIYALDGEALAKMAKRLRKSTDMQRTPKYGYFDYTLY